jgi:hypothetical protein
VTATYSASPTASLTPTISPTFSNTLTPAPTATQVAAAVLSSNVFKPELGQPLQVWVKPVASGRVWVRIYNLAGELVQPLFEGEAVAGASFAQAWDGRNAEGQWVASGVYFVSVKGAGIRSIKKVIVLR